MDQSFISFRFVLVETSEMFRFPSLRKRNIPGNSKFYVYSFGLCNTDTDTGQGHDTTRTRWH